jgi:hypothetical protein
MILKILKNLKDINEINEINNYSRILIYLTCCLIKMPKNKGRGGKNYKKGKHSGPAKRDLLMK